MRKCFFVLCFLLTVNVLHAQRSFKGTVMYYITVIGAENPRTDSMMIVFDDNRVKVVMFLPDMSDSSRVDERSFIDDFELMKTLTISESDKTYKVDTLKPNAIYAFKNTQRYAAVGNYLCFDYTATPLQESQGNQQKVSCLCSIDYFYSWMKDYSFFGYQPVVVDNRLVLDYSITQSNGNKPTVFAKNVTVLENVNSYFDLDDYSMRE